MQRILERRAQQQQGSPRLGDSDDHAGESVVDPTIVASLVRKRRDDERLAELTARERDVLGLMAEGMSNRAIAERLFITERTVETHTSQIFLKLRLQESPQTHRRVLAVLAFLRE